MSPEPWATVSYVVPRFELSRARLSSVFLGLESLVPTGSFQHRCSKALRETNPHPLMLQVIGRLDKD